MSLHTEGYPLQLKKGYILQLESQPSPLIDPPSSHSMYGFSFPGPQIF